MKMRIALLLAAAVPLADVHSVFIWSGVLGAIGGASAAFRNFSKANKINPLDLAAHTLNMGSVGAAYSMIMVSRLDEVSLFEGWGIVGTAFILGVIGMPTIDLFFDLAKRIIAGIKSGNTGE